MFDDNQEDELAKFPEKFIDEHDISHKRSTKLGQGGQGIVLRSDDPDVAIKLVTNDQQELLEDPKKIQECHRKFKMLRRLPLPLDIEVCKPMAKLRDHAGYVMRLLSTMKPVDELWPHPKHISNIKLKDIPEWLDELAKINLNYSKWLTHYLQTGGIKSRLAILSETARVIAHLHASGLVYGDINQENIFYSFNQGLAEVWLIDADNIIFETKKNKQIVYTPKFAAPELRKLESGIQFRTDVHAFAVLAYKMLSLNHPFEGQSLEEDGGWEDASLEDDALDVDTKVELGLYPFVDHPTDTSNRLPNTGVPSTLFYTEDLKNLFIKTFVDGLHQPHLRPTMSNWHSTLRKAADSCLECTSCQMTYQPMITDHPYQCPFCQHIPQYIIKINKYILNNEGKLDPKSLEYMYLTIKDQKNYLIPSHLFTDLDSMRASTYPLEISFKDKFMLLSQYHPSLELRIAQSHGDRSLFKALKQTIVLDVNKTDIDMWITPQKDSRYLTKLELISVGDHA